MGVPEDRYEEAYKVVGSSSIRSPFDYTNIPYIRLAYWCIQNGFMNRLEPSGQTGTSLEIDD